jgi:hypothetical protein
MRIHILHMCFRTLRKRITMCYFAKTSLWCNQTHSWGITSCIFASSAIQQIDYVLPSSIKRFHTLECGFLNHLYYHTPNVRKVYRYNSARRLVKDINLLDYDYLFISTKKNKLHWVIFVIVPAERRMIVNVAHMLIFNT